MSVGLVLDQIGFARFCVEDEDRAHFLIGDIKIIFRVHGHAVRLAQLEEDFRVLAGGSRTRKAIHPFRLLRIRGFDLRQLLRRIKRLVADPRNRRRIRPNNTRIVDDRNLLGLSVVLFLLVAKQRHWRAEHEAQKNQPRHRALEGALCIHVGLESHSRSPHPISSSSPYGSWSRTADCWPDPSPTDRAAPKNAVDGSSGNRSWNAPW